MHPTLNTHKNKHNLISTQKVAFTKLSSKGTEASAVIKVCRISILGVVASPGTLG